MAAQTAMTVAQCSVGLRKGEAGMDWVVIVSLLGVMILLSALLYFLLKGQVERYARLCDRRTDHDKQAQASMVAAIIENTQIVVRCIDKEASPKGQDCLKPTCSVPNSEPRLRGVPEVG